MTGRDPRYDILFEPVRIGPVIAKNRFYQVPHCNGMGDQFINSQIRYRELKAEGGWAVVNTENAESQASGDEGFPLTHLWDDGDIAPLAKIVDAIHKHGALAGTEIGHLGAGCANLYSREAPIGPSTGPLQWSIDPHASYPIQVRAMDRADIRRFLENQRSAARRARIAGCDIICAWATSVAGPPMSFMSRRFNHRSDGYGGSLQNRVRLLKEFIEVTREGAGPDRAVAVRLGVDELLGAGGIEVEEEGAAVMDLIGELPDLWDIVVQDWENDSIASRFGGAGSIERYLSFIKQRTTKPVVGVGRFTSPDMMVSVLRRKVQDFIGAARPSIADPFLPRKIEEGRIEDIRECIGCNMCITGYLLKVPTRCTQNPTVGEEWRRNWHPERVPPSNSASRILIVGAGPAGLECAHILGKRGYEVALAEASKTLGGRVSLESRLPALSEWGRVRDYRVHQLGKLSNVSVYPDNRLTAEDILGFGFENVVIATGATWRRDGFGSAYPECIKGSDQPHVFSADHILRQEKLPDGPVVVVDDDHYYMANVIAEKLRKEGRSVYFVTAAPEPAPFTHYTMERRKTLERIYGLGIEVLPLHRVMEVCEQEVVVTHVHSGLVARIACTAVIMVTTRLPNDSLHADLVQDEAKLRDAGILSVRCIGDCYIPSTIASAVWWGHRYAEEFDSELSETELRRERSVIFTS